MITRSVQSISHTPFKAAPLAAAIAALTLSLPRFALADVPAPSCDQQVCTVPVTEQLFFEVGADSFVNFDSRFELRGHVILRTPLQSFTLEDADLVLEKTPEGAPLPFRLSGTARMQMAGLPLYGDSSPLDVSPVAVIDMVDRETLKGLLEDEDTKLPLSEIPKDPYGDPNELTDPAYILLHFEAGLSAEAKLAEWLMLDQIGMDPDALTVSMPMDASVTVIVDPDEPYFLFARDGDINILDKLSPEHQAAAAHAQAMNAQTSPTSGNALLELASPIPELGTLAFSAQGGIPFEPRHTWGLPDDVGNFKGHLHVDSDLSLKEIVTIDGTIVSRISEQDGLIGAQFGANGALGLEFDMIPGLEFDLDLWDATLGMFITQDDAEIYFSGALARDASFLPESIPLAPLENTHIAGYISRYRLDESRITADGRYGLDMSNFSRMTGVTLNKLEIAHAHLSLDKKGVLVTGRTGGSIHPDVDLKTEANITVWISFSDPQASYLKMSGEMSVLGAGFKPVDLIVNRLGLTASGVFATPISKVTMIGKIDGNGPRLFGSTMTTVHFSHNEIMAPLAPLDAAVHAAMVELGRIRTERDKAREIVEQERAQLEEALQKAQDALAKLQDDVDWYRARLAAHYGNIGYWRTEIANKWNWYDNLSEVNKVLNLPGTLAYVGERAAWITAEWVKVADIRLKKTAAETALSAASLAVETARAALPSIPVDADPRVALYLVPLRAVSEVLDAAQKARDERFAELPDWAKRGGISGMLQLQLDRSGMSGTIYTLPYNTQVSARIELDGNPKICLDFPKVGKVCKAL